MKLRFINPVRAALAAVCLVLSTAVPAGAATAAELHAYVGAGLRPPVDTLIEMFQAEAGIAVHAEYGGSGQLLSRFQETGKGDLFIPGSTLYTDKLRNQGSIAEVRALVLHGPVLAVTLDQASTITSFADLAKPGVRLGLGDPQAMALGRTAEEILNKSGQGEAIRRNVTVHAATVKQLALYVLDGNVDAAIIGMADAAQNAGKLVFVTIPADWYTPDQVPVAVLTTAVDPVAAKRFADFLASERGLAVFQRFGFPPALSK